MCLGFQVADVKKPLVSVKRIVEKGNHVVFGPGHEGNYIENKSSGRRLMLRPNGRGSYLMDVEFKGGAKTSITVDSGAEESVCPRGWGSPFPIIASVPAREFRNASGCSIAHYGPREVMLVSPL